MKKNAKTTILSTVGIDSFFPTNTDIKSVSKSTLDSVSTIVAAQQMVPTIKNNKGVLDIVADKAHSKKLGKLAVKLAQDEMGFNDNSQSISIKDKLKQMAKLDPPKLKSPLKLQTPKPMIK